MNTAADVRIAPLIRGTQEKNWQKVLAQAPLWSPANGPLLIVSAHPDNEVLAAGGLIHMWKQAGRSVTILSLTDGETIHPGRRARVPREELKEALQVLSPSPVLVVGLGIPRGRVAECTSRLRGALVSLVVPGMTVLAPYENDGFPDHDAAGRIIRDLAQTLGLPLARYPVWTWHHGDPAAMAGLPWRRFSLSEAAQAAKAHAVRCFASRAPSYKRGYFARPYEAFIV